MNAKQAIMGILVLILVVVGSQVAAAWLPRSESIWASGAWGLLMGFVASVLWYEMED